MVHEQDNPETAMAIADKALEPYKDNHLMLIGVHDKEMTNSDYHVHGFVHTTNYNNGSMIYAENKTTFPVAQCVANITKEECLHTKKKEGNMKKEFRKKFYPHNI